MPWAGTERGCYNRGLFQDSWVETYDSFANHNSINRSTGANKYSDRSEHCDNIWGRDSIEQSIYYGKQICGKRGGVTYKDATRANADGDCPSGFEACSKNTSPADTWCVKNSHDEECPVNDIAISNVKKNGFTAQLLNDEYYFMYSKTSDERPIMKFFVGE